MYINFGQRLRAGWRQNWQHYLTEAAGAALFIIVASLITIAVKHPSAPLHSWLEGREYLGRAVVGLVVGTLVVLMVYSPWGRRSGAHFNPAVTLAFWQLGKVNRVDAVWYVLFQVVGAVTGAQLIKRLLGTWYAHPEVNYVLTEPGKDGLWVAVGAEFLISLVLMLILLTALHSKRLHNKAGWLLGALLAVYIVFEEPYSGMSTNPARSLASAVAAGSYASLWLYVVAPVLAMWLATLLFKLLYHNQPLPMAILAGSEAPTAATEHQPPQYPDANAEG
ncbi:MIP/aquaporin family protein [Hymenobacter sp. GOD-10R]|uniref:MIP/aquaporin family protein n=1 Tax=Hymenobacter sp. GOD-10R TaxID=3093922 RepID=UPI002D7814FF|nr:aquaporin [Hymenobacter sp. GOD-10R]WRQ28847.1 aquaporin [Hymenobacter sp. GOD-10R]